MEKEEYSWLKSKGYLHITAQIDVTKKRKEILNKVTNPNYISKYAFFPLIHSIIKERKYKKIEGTVLRAHSYTDSKGKHKRTEKNRPLHYATHMDAIIFGYYADVLQNKYERILETEPQLSESIIAYRKIPIKGGDANKGTIHFAHEIFEEIRERAKNNGECFVLAFDIKSFFSSLNHEILKTAWAKLIDKDKLPDDHYNVFKASTRFSYIMRDDLRVIHKRKGKRAGFDERELARIRNKFGINAFFESPKVFRDKIKAGELKIHKKPFRDKKTGEIIGIPQGLPISAVLANLYLLEFDMKIQKQLVENFGCYYKRYSDDIAIVCKKEEKDFVEKFVMEAMEKSRVSISVDKTEIFQFTNNEGIMRCHKVSKAGEQRVAPFIYLGFEFNGQHSFIKSGNLSKFYRRMVFSVRRKAKRALKIADANPGSKPVIFRRQLYKLYSALDLTKTKVHTRWKRLIKTETGNYQLKTGMKTRILRSNYFSYARRASEIMNEPKIYEQVRNHRKLFNQAIHKHLGSPQD